MLFTLRGGHCLRHTFASRLVMAGLDIRTVAELVGHKALQMTVGTGLAPQHNAAAVAKLDHSIFGTDTTTSTMLQRPVEFHNVLNFQQVAKKGP
jgi:Phage integrase family